jgi:hypothetical protein
MTTRETALDPNLWFGNVENVAAAISGRETVQYASKVWISLAIINDTIGVLWRLEVSTNRGAFHDHSAH